MIRRPPRSTLSSSSAASDVYKRQVININNPAGVNYVVTGNFIGGTSPSCGGTAWTKTASANSAFTAINVNVGTATASSVQNNTIKNMVWGNSGAALWTGINIAAGIVNIGTTAGNTMGCLLY